MSSILLTIPRIPKGQMRARATSRGKFASVYKCKVQRDEEAEMLKVVRPLKPENPFEGPISLSVKAYMPIPKSEKKGVRQLMELGKVRHTKKPDLDNIVKNVKDVLTQARFWNDDAQVVICLASKEYGVKPRYEIRIQEI